MGSQHNCFANSFQYGFTGATSLSPYSLMEDLIFGHDKKQATKKASHKHSAVLQKCPVPILTWPKLAQFRRDTRIKAKGGWLHLRWGNRVCSSHRTVQRGKEDCDQGRC